MSCAVAWKHNLDWDFCCLLVFGPWQSYPITSQIVLRALPTMRVRGKWNEVLHMMGIYGFPWLILLPLPPSFGNLFADDATAAKQSTGLLPLCPVPPCSTPAPAQCVLRVIPFPPQPQIANQTQQEQPRRQLLLASVFACTHKEREWRISWRRAGGRDGHRHRQS